MVEVVEVEEDGKRKWWWWHEDPREGHTTGNTRRAGQFQLFVWLAAVGNERDGRWKQGIERGGQILKEV